MEGLYYKPQLIWELRQTYLTKSFFCKDESQESFFSVVGWKSLIFQKSIHLERVDFLLGAMLVEDSLQHSPTRKWDCLQVGGGSSGFVYVEIYVYIFDSTVYRCT